MYDTSQGGAQLSRAPFTSQPGSSNSHTRLSRVGTVTLWRTTEGLFRFWEELLCAIFPTP